MQQNEKNTITFQDVGIVWEAKKPLAVLCKSVQEDLQPFQCLMDVKNSGARGDAATNFFVKQLYTLDNVERHSYTLSIKW